MKTTCPEKIKLKLAELSVEKCKENLKFWQTKLDIDKINPEELKEILELSNNILPCHTSAYENIENIFFTEIKSDTYFPEATGLVSLDIRQKRKKKSINGNAPFMKDSIKLGHEVFLFAYHNVHNPYHRQNDEVPVKPIGFFLKKEIEILTCVHGSPCDIAEKNETVNEYRIKDLDKFYLCPKDMRSLKPYQIKTDSYLNNDFWFYYGDPISWRNQKAYGLKLFERAGEFRYLNNIDPEQIEAILWPTWEDDEETKNKNLELYFRIRDKYPSIKRIQYNRDKYNNNWALSFVEASYFSQRHFIEFGSFEDHADNAKLKIEYKYGISNNTHN